MKFVVTRRPRTRLRRTPLHRLRSRRLRTHTRIRIRIHHRRLRLTLPHPRTLRRLLIRLRTLHHLSLIHI